MTDSDSKQPSDKDKFLGPQSRYYGEFTPTNLAFNANLQEFAQRIGYICSLETGGKMTPEEAYQGIKQAWKELKKSRKGLKIDE
ncbi:MAG: hypothetical protein ACFCBU_13390 [Cyanophyceae cyanobacterium]